MAQKRRHPDYKNPYKEDFAPSYSRRASFHDYRSRCIYHVILKKRSGCPDFGVLRGNPDIKPGLPGSPYIYRNQLGNVIAETLFNLPRTFPVLQLLQYCVMPDHVHFIILVKEPTEQHFSYFIVNLESKIAAEYGRLVNKELRGMDIFQSYTDKPLFKWRSLETLMAYVKANPYRLAVRRDRPLFFKRLHKLFIGGKSYEAYGNPFLFANPDKISVKTSRRHTPAQSAALREYWLDEAAHGAVAVSPFIAPAEKEIRKEIEELGGNIIHIRHEAFTEKYKPAKHDFDLCGEGRLLIISLGEPVDTPISRELCNRMNGLAAEMSNRGLEENS